MLKQEKVCVYVQVCVCAFVCEWIFGSVRSKPPGDELSGGLLLLGKNITQRAKNHDLLHGTFKRCVDGWSLDVTPGKRLRVAGKCGNFYFRFPRDSSRKKGSENLATSKSYPFTEKKQCKNIRLNVYNKREPATFCKVNIFRKFIAKSTVFEKKVNALLWCKGYTVRFQINEKIKYEANQILQ